MFEKSFNATSIALILIIRRHGQRSSKIFRSISLIENFYKLRSNVLRERLKRPVDKQRMTFIKGRHIKDAVLIANEAIDFRISLEKPGIFCKLDSEKGYDMSIGSSFLVC